MCILAKHLSPANMIAAAVPGSIQADSGEDVSAILAISKSQTYRFLKRMIKFGLIAKMQIRIGGITQTQYYVNPIYWFSGNRIPLNLYLLFRMQLNAVLPGWVIQRYGNLIELQRHKK